MPHDILLFRYRQQPMGCKDAGSRNRRHACLHPGCTRKRMLFRLKKRRTRRLHLSDTRLESTPHHKGIPGQAIVQDGRRRYRLHQTLLLLSCHSRGLHRQSHGVFPAATHIHTGRTVTDVRSCRFPGHARVVCRSARHGCRYKREGIHQEKDGSKRVEAVFQSYQRASLQHERETMGMGKAETRPDTLFLFRSGRRVLRTFPYHRHSLSCGQQPLCQMRNLCQRLSRNRHKRRIGL